LTSGGDGLPPESGDDEDADPNAAVEDCILHALDEAYDRRGVLSEDIVDEVVRLFPGRAGVVKRLARAMRRYAALTARLGRPEAEQLPPGTRVGDFEITAFVARGGTAAVYRARQLSLGGREVALKVLDAGCLGAGPDIPRFQDEAAVLAGLHHPHLAEVFGSGRDDGRPYYAMRFIPGPTLREILDRLVHARGADRPLTPEHRRTIICWGRQAALALAHVHAAGLVHRDVKPSNLMVDGQDPGGDVLPNAPAVLVDFGLVRGLSMPDRTLTRLGAGSPPYSAPEQFARKRVDARTDVFALGATLHDLLVRRQPEERAEAEALPPLRTLDPGADADLEAIIARATDRRAAWRYKDAADLADDLSAWLAGKPVRARTPPLGERLHRAIARNPRRVARALGTAIAAALLLVIGATVADAWTHLERARAAHRAADIGAVSDALGGLDTLGTLLLTLSGDDVLHGVHHELRAAAQDDEESLSSIARAWRAGDSGHALFLTASRLTRHGPVENDLLLRSMLASLDAEATVAGAALELLARMAYERPAVSPDERHALAPLCNRAWSLLSDVSRPRNDRLLALTILSGCAPPGDAKSLAQLALSRPTELEWQRVGLLASERVLRRSLTAGDMPHLDGCDEDWQPVYAWIRQAWDRRVASVQSSNPVLSHDTYEAALLLERALTSVARRQGTVLRLGDLRSMEFVARLASEDTQYVRHAPPVDELVGLELQTWIDRVGAPILSTRDPFLLGWLAAVAADHEQVTRLRREAASLGAEARGGFERGLAAATKHGRGSALDYELDGDTKLGARREDHALVSLEVAHGSPPWLSAFESFEDDALATWCILPSQIQLNGWGLGLAACRPEIIPYGKLGYLRLSQPERSTLLLTFERPREAALPFPTALRLLALAPSRVYYPLKGWTALRLALDGSTLGTYHVFQHQLESPIDIPLPARSLHPGRHDIEITLDRASLSPAWIFGAAIVEQ